MKRGAFPIDLASQTSPLDLANLAGLCFVLCVNICRQNLPCFLLFISIR
jgi:hypothetical protein